MNQNLMSLSGAAKVLGVRPHQVAFAIVSFCVPEPAMRVANRRVFQQEDIDRLEEYFAKKKAAQQPQEPE
jgi:hypothetical protein